jgi:hypothetical protein
VEAFGNTSENRMQFNNAEKYTYWYWLLDVHTWVHKFSKIQEPPQNSRCQKGDMKQVPY